MILAHRIALAPTFRQRAYFVRACGTARFVYNWALAEWNRRYRTGDRPNGKTLKRAFNAVKYDAFPWLKDVHRDAHAQPFANLQKAFIAFFKGDAEHPAFKKKGRCRESFYVANDKLRLGGRRVRLPIVGWVRMRESLRFAGKVMGAIVSREADRWFASIQVKVDDCRRPRTGDGEVGIDLGLTTFATLSSGEKVTGPKPLRAVLRKLRRCARKVSRRPKGSHRREQAQRVLSRLHVRVKNLRADFCHQLTTRLCRENQAVGVESLKVAGMVRNRQLARAIADAGWGEFLRQVAYKGPLFACEVVFAPPFYPSTKRCHRCHMVKAEMLLSERVFRCEGCGLVCDRDNNAARNLLPQALREVTAVDSTVRPGANRADEVEAATIPCAPSRTK